MAVNPVFFGLYTSQNVTGPDAITTRYGGGSSAAAGVANGGVGGLARDASNLLQALPSGVMNVTATAAQPIPTPQLTAMDGCTMGNATCLFTGNGTAADTVTINGQALTAVASGAVNNQWNIGTSTATAAANLVSCINSSTTAAIYGTCRAYVSPTNSALVVVQCIFPGVISALVTIAKTSTSITLTGANLSGVTVGAMNAPLTLAH